MFNQQPQYVSFRALRPTGAIGPDLRRRRAWYDGEGGNPTDGQGNGGGQSDGSGGTSEPTWETWLASRPEAERATIQKLYEAQTQGLRGALDKERESRSALERELRTISGKLKDDDENKQKLTQFADQLGEANRRADFFQEAAKPDVGLSDPEAAWIIVNARADEFFDRKGNVNLALLRQKHPGLFQQATPRGNGGSGHGQGGSSKTDMNSLIRNSRR